MDSFPLLEVVIESDMTALRRAVECIAVKVQRYMRNNVCIHRNSAFLTADTFEIEVRPGTVLDITRGAERDLWRDGIGPLLVVLSYDFDLIVYAGALLYSEGPSGTFLAELSK